GRAFARAAALRAEQTSRQKWAPSRMQVAGGKGRCCSFLIHSAPSPRTTTGRVGSPSRVGAAALACWPISREGPKVAASSRFFNRCLCLGGFLGPPRLLQEKGGSKTGSGRSSISEQTTATLPSIPARCSRRHTQPPSRPKSIGCFVDADGGCSWNPSGQGGFACSCC